MSSGKSRKSSNSVVLGALKCAHLVEVQSVRLPTCRDEQCGQYLTLRILRSVLVGGPTTDNGGSCLRVLAPVASLVVLLPRHFHPLLRRGVCVLLLMEWQICSSCLIDSLDLRLPEPTSGVLAIGCCPVVFLPRPERRRIRPRSGRPGCAAPVHGRPCRRRGPACRWR